MKTKLHSIKNISISILKCMLMVFFIPVNAEEKKIILGISIGQGEPYVFEKSINEKGILIDVFSLISKKNNNSFTIQYAPPARTKRNFLNNSINVEVGINPEWRKDQKHISRYSIPFVLNRNSIVYKKNSPLLQHPKDDMELIKIGMINGWSYPTLPKKIKSRRIIRYNYRTIQLQIKNLNRGRIDAIIANRLAVEYFIKKNNYTNLIIKDDISSLPLMIRFRPEIENHIEEYNNALRFYLKNGEIKKIFNKYNVEFHPP